ncbi:MAG: aminotransferase class I/II-fold pyridoxal phosphate-dependent enzyme [Nannocystis sp.]|nr:aminotransferase class I/II-fold pyridoxal phosphate-dependent enzyme [Nannocystis sp.]
MPDLLEQRLTARLADLRSAGLGRDIPPISAREGLRYRLNGRPVVSFCSNDYLGLASASWSGELTSAALGAGASRLVCGEFPEHHHLERRLAELAGSEDAVLFPSAFQLNLGALPALIAADDRVFSDRLNHASLIDGLRLAEPRPQILPHLASPPASSQPTWWVTESTFSMDGDGPAPADLRAHLHGGGLLYLDEAHSFALYPGAASLSRHLGIRPTVLVGALGKAIGCAGAVLAASAIVCRWIRARCRSFVFSTGLAPILARAIEHQLDRACGDEGDARRDRLWRNIAHLTARLGLTRPTPTPIFPILVRDNHRALAISAELQERGWHIQAIRPPTVPEGTARLRLTVSAAHEADDIDAMADDLLTLLRRHGHQLGA